MSRSVIVACCNCIALLMLHAPIGWSAETACATAKSDPPCCSEPCPPGAKKGELIRKAICVMIAPAPRLPHPPKGGIHIGSRDLSQTIPALFERARREWDRHTAKDARACAATSPCGPAGTCDTPCDSHGEACVESAGACSDCPDCVDCCDAPAEQVAARCGGDDALDCGEQCECESACAPWAACPPPWFTVGRGLHERLTGALMENERLRARLKAQQQVTELKEAYLHELVELRRELVERDVEVLLAEKEAEAAKELMHAHVAKAQYEFFFQIAGKPAEVLARLVRSKQAQVAARDRLCSQKCSPAVEQFQAENRLLQARVADLEKRVAELRARIAEKPSATTR